MVTTGVGRDIEPEKDEEVVFTIVAITGIMTLMMSVYIYIYIYIMYIYTLGDDGGL